ncbi:hypothetical protein MJO28_001722, partial [Puccinia striiformis f. sp. tritici]
ENQGDTQQASIDRFHLWGHGCTSFDSPTGGSQWYGMLSCLSGLVFFCTSQAASAFCKSCNFSSSIATRITYCLILTLNSLLAWIMLTPFAIKKTRKLEL